MRIRETQVKVVDRRWWAQQGQTAETAGTDAEAAAPAEAWQPGKPTYVEELERRLAEKDQQLQETVARYRDASREFDDARVRLRKDVARDVERGRRAILVELLDVLDNLDRAIEAARGSTDGRSSWSTASRWCGGCSSPSSKGFGVRPIDALGERFDPTRHEAVTIVPTAGASRDGVICGVLTHGLCDRGRGAAAGDGGGGQPGPGLGA